MHKKISFFNHKGGVSKTTTTFNIGWMLAEKGYKVVMVDADPQCNLTGLVMGYKGASELETFYKSETERNLRAGLAPAFESRPKLIEGVECVAVSSRPGLYLLPGHIRLAEYEVTLGIAQELSSSIETLQNLPGSIAFLLDKTAKKFKADYVLIDMSPSLSSINKNLVMISDYFILPTSPDYFSVMAIDSLTTILPKWASWSKTAQNLQILQEASYPFPTTVPKFLGVVIQNYRPSKGAPAVAFQQWIDEIKTIVSDKFVPALTNCNMMLPPSSYTDRNLSLDYCLTTIRDFNSLIAKSQKHQTPVFALTDAQIGQRGHLLTKSKESRDEFKNSFSDLADKVVELTTNAESDRSV